MLDSLDDGQSHRKNMISKLAESGHNPDGSNRGGRGGGSGRGGGVTGTRGQTSSRPLETRFVDTAPWITRNLISLPTGQLLLQRCLGRRGRLGSSKSPVLGYPFPSLYPGKAAPQILSLSNLKRTGTQIRHWVWEERHQANPGPSKQLVQEANRNVRVARLGHLVVVPPLRLG